MESMIIYLELFMSPKGSNLGHIAKSVNHYINNRSSYNIILSKHVYITNKK